MGLITALSEQESAESAAELAESVVTATQEDAMQFKQGSVKHTTNEGGDEEGI